MAPSNAEELVTQVGVPVPGSMGSRLTGIDHGSAVVARVETQRSWLPQPPGVRLEVTIISRPSRRRMAVRVSRRGLLSSSTLKAGPQSWSLQRERLLCVFRRTSYGAGAEELGS